MFKYWLTMIISTEPGSSGSVVIVNLVQLCT